MKNLGIPVALACGVGLVASVMALGQAQSAPRLTTAPAFSAMGSDGKTHTLSSLTAKGDVFLYFIKEDCPINDQALKYFNQLGAAYKDKATIVGVFNGNEAKFKRWQAKSKLPIMSLYDPDLKIVKSYKADASPWMIHVAKDGKVAKIWPGYSVAFLNEMNASMAGAAKVPAAKLDLAGAPNNTRYG
jgi:peroxiredoxin